jgi:hypothetical protein
MSGICNTLASIGGSNANPAAVSQMLSGARAVRKGRRSGNGGGTNAHDWSRKNCEDEGKCGTAKQKTDYCVEKNRDQRCYDPCCKKEDDNACFPGEATAHVKGKGDVVVAALRVGDEVLVERQGQLVHEPILSFLHVIPKSKKPLPFVTVAHVHGVFRASAAHITFVATESGQSSKLVGKLQAGDIIFAACDEGSAWDAKPSKILAIKEGNTNSGMYAPLTASGTIVVDGVLASNYASSSEEKHLPHHWAHALFLPVRIYHYFGLNDKLQHMWRNVCIDPGAMTEWLCQGAGKAEMEELHPYLRVMWKGLKLNMIHDMIF